MFFGQGSTFSFDSMITDHANTKAQPAPVVGQQSVTDAVIADLNTRREHGIKKYSTELMTHNGRDAMVDAYQEAIDLAVYLKQELMERDAKATAEAGGVSPTGDVL